MEVIKEFEKGVKDSLDHEIPDFKVGDTVRVHQKIVEGNKERIQVFSGVVIAIKNKGASKTFTVRRISYDVGVERIFPLYSPRIARIEVARRGKVRRAKLYYLREKLGKQGRIKEKHYAGVGNKQKGQQKVFSASATVQESQEKESVAEQE